MSKRLGIFLQNKRIYRGYSIKVKKEGPKMFIFFHKMKMNSTKILLLFIIGFFLVAHGFAQTAFQSYPEGKIFFKNGAIIEGKNLEITSDSAILEVSSFKQTYHLDEIQQIMAKKGKAKEMANICGGGCLSLALVSYLASGGESTDEFGNTVEIDFGTYMLGSGMWVAIFYGTGYLIGRVMDDWQVVYFET